MKIFVALWSHNTETDKSSLGLRYAALEDALKVAKQKFTAARTLEFTGQIKAIFVAPEYLFADDHDDEKRTRTVDKTSKKMMVTRLKELSRVHPDMLLIPGTIIYRIESDWDFMYYQKRDKAVERLYELQNKNTLINNMKRPDNPLTMQSKISALTHKTKKEALVKNKMYVFLNGEVVATYGKTADFYEATGDVPGVFIPGRKAGIQKVGGIRFGFEICYDAQMGVMKSNNLRTPPDIHVIASAHVENKDAKMHARPGGYILHACSLDAETAVYRKGASGLPAPVPPGETVPVGGSPLKCWTLDYTPV